MAKLIVTLDGERKEIEVLPLTTIGRHPEATVPLLDELVSKHHCQVVALDGGRFILRDCQSRNGTWLRGVRVAERELMNGDEFIVGSAVIKLIGAAAPTTLASGSHRYVEETAKELATHLEAGDEDIAEPADALAIARRLDEGCQRLLVRFNELGALVAVLSGRTSTNDKRLRTVEETGARMGETILSQERLVREVWSEVGRLCENLEGHEQRLQQVARDQADLRRQLGALGLQLQGAPEVSGISAGATERLDPQRKRRTASGG